MERAKIEKAKRTRKNKAVEVGRHRELIKAIGKLESEVSNRIEKIKLEVPNQKDLEPVLLEINEGLLKLLDVQTDPVTVKNISEARPQEIKVKNLPSLPKWMESDPKFGEIAKVIKANTLMLGELRKAQGDQQPSSFIPYRRVRKVGNRFEFDDTSWSGTPGGGSVASSGGSASIDTTGLASDSNQTNGAQKSQLVDSGGEAATVTGGKLDVNASVDTTGLALAANQQTDALTDTELRATAVPVSTSSLPLPDGASTSAKQDTGNTSLSSLESKTGIVTESAPATDIASSGLNGRLQRIAQRITSLIALLPTSLGQKTKDNSLAVTLASNQDTLAVSSTNLDIRDLASATDSVTTVPSGTQTISGSVTANIGTVGTLATASKQDTGNTSLGTIAGAVAGTEMQVDVLTMPAITASNLDIRDLAQTSDNVRVYANTAKDGSGTGYVPLVDTDGHMQVDVLSGGGGGTQYTEGDTDASITGTAILWEDGSDTLRAVSTTKPLPVDLQDSSIAVTDNGGSLTVDGTVAISNSSIPVTDNGGSLTVDNGGTFAVQADTELTTSDLDIGAGTDTRAVVGLVGSKSGGGVLIPGDSTAGLKVDLGADNDVTVTGTVTANAGTGTLGTNLAQVAGTTTDVNSGTKSAGTQRMVIATDQPALTNALKVDGSAVTQPVSGTVTAAQATASSLNAQVVGTVAQDAAIAGNPVNNGYRASAAVPTAMSADGDAVYGWADRSGRQVVTMKAATGTQTSVGGSATNVTLLAANTSRLGATLYNDSTAICYVRLAATATSANFSVKMQPEAYYEVPFGYAGIIDGIWASGTGNMRVTEIT